MAEISQYTVVLPQNASFNEKRAAAAVRRAARLVTGAMLPLVTDAASPTEREIAVGRTNREALCDLSLERSPKRNWEYRVQTVGERVFLTGLGLPPEEKAPYLSAYTPLDDGAYGTAVAAYRFCEEALGYYELYEAFEEFPTDPHRKMPDLNLIHTKESLLSLMPPRREGATMFSVPCGSIPHLNMSCTVFRTQKGTLGVLDGGRAGDAEHVVSVLEALSPGKKPVVEAWLFSHLHRDHYGVLCAIASDPALRERLEIRRFYHGLLSREDYTLRCREHSPDCAEPYEILTTLGRNPAEEIFQVKKGDVIALDELRFHTLHVPEAQRVFDMNVNDTGVVWRLDCPSGKRVMLLNDGEWVVNEALMSLPPEQLRADLVQVGHHGCGNVSRECYERIGGKEFLFQISDRFWYSERGEGLIRSRLWLMELGARRECIHRDTHKILAFSLA